jgi:hypothetical protein
LPWSAAVRSVVDKESTKIGCWRISRDLALLLIFGGGRCTLLTRIERPATERGPSGKGGAVMEICTTTGARCFPQRGHLAMPGEVWSKRLPTAPIGALRLRAGRSFHRTVINPTGIDLLVTDRMRTSASEP